MPEATYDTGSALDGLGLRPDSDAVRANSLAPARKSAIVQNDKSELWRIRRELKTLLDRIDKLILSQD